MSKTGLKPDSPVAQILAAAKAPKLKQHEWLFLRKHASIHGAALSSPTFLVLVGKGYITADAKLTALGVAALSKGFDAPPKPGVNLKEWVEETFTKPADWRE